MDHKQYIILDIIFNYISYFGLQENVFIKVINTTLPFGGAGKGDFPNFYYEIFQEVQNKHILK